MINVLVKFNDPTFGIISVNTKCSLNYLIQVISQGSFNGKEYTSITILNN